jgi:hypothetical protein
MVMFTGLDATPLTAIWTGTVPAPFSEIGIATLI